MWYDARPIMFAGLSFTTWGLLIAAIGLGLLIELRFYFLYRRFPERRGNPSKPSFPA
tara:strand:- start:445 stop:615 length:171 start_codon:yes stop_codon:yes gene_type:complete